MNITVCLYEYNFYMGVCICIYINLNTLAKSYGLIYIDVSDVLFVTIFPGLHKNITDPVII